MMKKSENGSIIKIDAWTKEQVENLLNRFGVKLNNESGYDFVYVANMCKADFLGKSVIDEQHLAMYVRDVIDDIDATDGHIFRAWYAKMIGNGTSIEWTDFL